MIDLDLILMRLPSTEFKAAAQQCADELWDTIHATICESIGYDPAEQPSTPEWVNFYLPAMRRDVLRLLAEKCSVAEKGWHEAFCNSIREASRG